MPTAEDTAQPGEFVINIGHGRMRCGYCEHDVSWALTTAGGLVLTGFHTLGIETATNTLVVLAEATTPTGRITHLPHDCTAIPDDVAREYAPLAKVRRDTAA